MWRREESCWAPLVTGETNSPYWELPQSRWKPPNCGDRRGVSQAECHCGHCRVETRGGEMGVEGTLYTPDCTTVQLYNIHCPVQTTHRTLLLTSLQSTCKSFSLETFFSCQPPVLWPPPHIDWVTMSCLKSSEFGSNIWYITILHCQVISVKSEVVEWFVRDCETRYYY